MSGLDQVLADFARAQAQLTRTVADAAGWTDEQRDQLDRARIEPLVRAAELYAAELARASASVEVAERSLGR